MAITRNQFLQGFHMVRLMNRQRELLIERRRHTAMLLKAIEHGVDIRTTDTWPRYQAIIDELWIVDNTIKAVRSCLI